MRGKAIRFARLFLGLMVVFFLISATAFASEQWLEYRSFANPQMMMNDVGSRKLICENDYNAISGIDNNWVRFICRGDSSNGLGMGTDPCLHGK